MTESDVSHCAAEIMIATITENDTLESRERKTEHDRFAV